MRAGSSETGQVCVVDNALFGTVAPEHQRLVQEALHVETVKAAVELQVASLRVTQVKDTGDNPDSLICEIDLIDAGVVLHLDARFVRYSVASLFSGLADTQITQHACQGLIRYLNAFFFGQFFVYALTIPIALTC